MVLMPPQVRLLEPRTSPCDDSQFQQFLAGAWHSPFIAVDTETTGAPEDGFDIRAGTGYCIGLSVSYILPGVSAPALYFPIRHSGPAVYGNLPPTYLPELKRLVEEHPVVVFQNAKHDLVSLATAGINRTKKFYCTMIMQHWIDENFPSKALDYMAQHYLKQGKASDDMFKNAIALFGWAQCPVELMAHYAAVDAYLTARLFAEFLYPEFVAQEFDTDELWGVEQDFIRLIAKMECAGIRVDMRLAEEQLFIGKEHMANITAELGLNPGSKNDLEELLINKLGLPVVKVSAKTGAPSFDKFAMAEYDEMLQRNNNPLAQQILEYRGWQKACSSYWENYRRLLGPDGRVRPNYKLHGTVTGRLSCEKPNLQQIPRQGEKDWNRLTKKGFIPSDGTSLLDADYAQLEFRLGAAYAYDYAPEEMQSLLDAFADPNRDVFQEMSQRIGFTRQDTKTTTYTIQFGGGANRLSQVFGVSLEDGARIRDQWFDAYPGFRLVSRVASQRCRSNGYLRLWTGRRRHFRDPQAEAHKAFNSVIQGGAAEIVKRAMLRIDRELSGPDFRLLLQVHDSVVPEVTKGMEEKYGQAIQEIMGDVRPDFGVTFRAQVKEWASEN